jgi:RHS repeat-associated protein
MKTSNRVGIRTCSDYSPFGVELDGRTVSGGYRYGYQGSEKDAELKGNGNSYTTEFRQLDPRLGRWLILDPKAKLQPYSSSHKTFLNNPIIFTDPEGGTQFLTIIIRNEQTGAFVKMSVPISDQIMTEGYEHEVGNSACWHFENAYYDFDRFHVCTITKDGQIIHTGQTKILEDNGVKDRGRTNLTI